MRIANFSKGLLQLILLVLPIKQSAWLETLMILFGSAKFLLSLCKLKVLCKVDFPETITNYRSSRNVESFILIIISCGPALSTFYVGTLMKSRFYSTLQNSMQRLISRTGRSRSHSTGAPTDTSIQYERGPSFPKWGNYQDISVRSTKSLVTDNQTSFELEPRKPSKTSPYSTLGEQEAGQADRIH